MLISQAKCTPIDPHILTEGWEQLNLVQMETIPKRGLIGCLVHERVQWRKQLDLRKISTTVPYSDAAISTKNTGSKPEVCLVPAILDSI